MKHMKPAIFFFTLLLCLPAAAYGLGEGVEKGNNLRLLVPNAEAAYDILLDDSTSEEEAEEVIDNIIEGDFVGWLNVCPDYDLPYCNEVGRGGSLKDGAPGYRAYRFGKIIGVSWQEAGDTIGHILRHGEDKPLKRVKARESGYYYIIYSRDESVYLLPVDLVQFR